MPQSHIKTRTPSQLAALLKRVASLVVEERIPRAMMLLEAIERQHLEPAEHFECLVQRADCYLASRQFAELEKLIVDLKSLARDDAQLLLAVLVDAHWRALAGRAHEAVSLVAHSARVLAPHDERRARAMRVVGVACYRTGHYHWARQCFQAAAAFYRLQGGTPGLIHCLNSLSLVVRSEGHPIVSLNYLDEAMRYLPRRGFSKTRLRLLINRGICLLKLGRLAEARSMFMEAKTRTTMSTDRVYQIMVLNNLGHTYRLQGNYDVAREYHGQALELARHVGSERQVALSLEFLGETFIEEHDGYQALIHLNEAHTIARQFAARGDVMMEVLRRRGEVHVMLGNTKAGADDLERAIQLCGSRGEKRESLLARRAYWLLKAADVQDLSTRMHAILEELEQLDDRFEYARTVYLILKDGRLDPECLPWLGDATVAATHYFTALGSKTWKSRLQEVSGPRRRITGIRGGENSLQEHVASRSPRFAAALDAVRVAARSSLPALIVGETGVGKEVIAQLLHRASPRAAATLTAINCGALPENLVESELFGYAQGAYTGAAKEKPGLFEAAHNGTVLLDEVGDLPPLAQVKLLRFLDTGEVRRVGELRTRRCDVRVLASTNRDLGVLVREGRFRADLMFRVAAFRIVVPPLRERAEDILDLARVFLREAAQGGAPPTVSAELEGWMLGYEWPGNVRELRNLCGYLHARSWGHDVIQVSDLPPEHQSSLATSTESELSPFERDLVEFERARLVKALKESRGNISGAARLLGMGRNTVSQRMRKFGLQRSAFEV